jgi:hypothetical protein
MPNNDLTTYTTAQLKSMLAQLKKEKEENKTGSTLTTNQIKSAQNKINQGNGRFPSKLDKYKKKN